MAKKVEKGISKRFKIGGKEGRWVTIAGRRFFLVGSEKTIKNRARTISFSDRDFNKKRKRETAWDRYVDKRKWGDED